MRWTSTCLVANFVALNSEHDKSHLHLLQLIPVGYLTPHDQYHQLLWVEQVLVG